MSEAEFIELIQSGLRDVALHMMNYASILFAFLVMAYFVGSKLSRFQVWSIVILYSTFIVLPGLGAVRAFSLTTDLVASLRNEFPELAARYYSWFEASGILSVLIAFVLIAAWALSLAFLQNSRVNQVPLDAT
jgi:hypothetical protein